MPEKPIIKPDLVARPSVSQPINEAFTFCY